MPASTLYWLTLISLGLCVLLSLLRRQTAARLATTQRQLLEERKDRERATSELVHVQSSRAAAEKEAEAAKKEAAAAKKEATAAMTSLGPRIEELEARASLLEGERDAANAEREARELLLEEKTKAEASAQSTITTLSREAEEARKLAATSQSKIAALEGKAREAEQAKAALAQAKKLAETREAEVKAALDREKSLAEELAKTKNAAAATPPPPTVAPVSAGADFLAALDADPYTNRGQKETIRMTYTQFTAKKRSS